MKKKHILLLLSPFILILLLVSIVIGIISLTLEVELIARQLDVSIETARLALLLFSCIAIPFQIIFIAFIFGVAFWFHRRSWAIAGSLLSSRWLRSGIVDSSAAVTALAGVDSKPAQPTNLQHAQTVQQVIASIISLTAFSIAIILSLAQFVRLSSLAVLITVITGGIAWGARTLIIDLLSGISNIFEDNFDVGDKIEFVYAAKPYEGIIEKVTVRLAYLRAPTGELIIVPHGEMRILRNFSRGQFSGTSVTLLIKSRDLQKSINILQALAPQTQELLPGLLEPWMVLSREGELGPETEITLIAKAAHGQGKVLRLKMMALAVERLQAEGISLGTMGEN